MGRQWSPRYSQVIPVSGCPVLTAVIDHNIDVQLQGRNMVYPGPTDPYFLAVILIPEPLFPQNFDP